MIHVSNGDEEKKFGVVFRFIIILFNNGLSFGYYYEPPAFLYEIRKYRQISILLKFFGDQLIQM